MFYLGVFCKAADYFLQTWHGWLLFVTVHGAHCAVRPVCLAKTHADLHFSHQEPMHAPTFLYEENVSYEAFYTAIFTGRKSFKKKSHSLDFKILN